LGGEQLVWTHYREEFERKNGVKGTNQERRRFLLQSTLTNSCLEQGIQVRGVACLSFVLVIGLLHCALYYNTITVLFYALLHWSFWIFPETAWRFIPYRQATHQFAVLFLFWYEPPGGDEFLPGGATLLHLI